MVYEAGICFNFPNSFHLHSKTHKSIAFVSVDIDDFDQIAAECAVFSIPAFITFENGKKVGATLSKFGGAASKEQQLRDLVEEIFSE